jgi:subtilisin family serine protease
MIWLVALRERENPDAFLNRHAGIAFTCLGESRRYFRFASAEVPESLASDPAVMAIEPDGETSIGTVQSISLTDSLQPVSGDGNWGIARHIRRAAPWNVDRIEHPLDTYFRAERDGTGVDIYIIDSGFLTTHVDIAGRATIFYDAVGIGGVDTFGHGTACAGCAGGLKSGIARGALLWSAKQYEDAPGSVGDLVACLDAVGVHYAGRSGTNRPAVLSVSITSTSALVQSATANLIDDGIVVVGSAGNDVADNSVTPLYPGNNADAISVGAIYANDTQTVFTNYGVGATGIDILAAGQALWIPTAPGDTNFRLWNGTSFAAPLVAGVIACMLEGKSRLTTRTQVQAVKAKLLANATAGRMRFLSNYGNATLPDRILYLDPNIASEVIDGVP